MVTLRKYSLLLVPVVLGISACSEAASLPVPSPSNPVSASPTQAPSIQPSSSPSSMPSLSPSLIPTEQVWSLTQLPVYSNQVDRGVLVVKIENDSQARPQRGLDYADVVVEEEVEGGITRFAAMFQSRLPQDVGPVRSVRHVDADISAPVADVFAYSGGSSVTLKYLRGQVGELPMITEGAAGFHRDSSKRAPHNLFLRPLNALKRVGTARNSALFSPGDQTSKVRGVASLTLAFSKASRPKWTWSGSSWLRSEGSSPARASDGNRLKADNVLVLRTKSVDAGYRDPAGNYVPRTLLRGKGRATLYMKGGAVDILWEKDSAHAPISLTTLDGQRVGMPVGTTWVELLDVKHKLSETL